MRRQPRLDRGERLVYPRFLPRLDSRLVSAKFAPQIVLHGHIIRRVEFGRDGEIEITAEQYRRLNLRQKRRSRKVAFQPVYGRQGLGNLMRSCIETRDCAVRIDRAIGLAPLFPFQQVYRDIVIIHALQVQRDPQTVAGGGTPIAVESDCGRHASASRFFAFSALAISCSQAAWRGAFLVSLHSASISRETRFNSAYCSSVPMSAASSTRWPFGSKK